MPRSKKRKRRQQMGLARAKARNVATPSAALVYDIKNNTFKSNLTLTSKASDDFTSNYLEASYKKQARKRRKKEKKKEEIYSKLLTSTLYTSDAALTTKQAKAIDATESKDANTELLLPAKDDISAWSKFMLSIPENSHKVYKEIGNILAQQASLDKTLITPGLDCCVVCGKQDDFDSQNVIQTRKDVTSNENENTTDQEQDDFFANQKEANTTNDGDDSNCDDSDGVNGDDDDDEDDDDEEEDEDDDEDMLGKCEECDAVCYCCEEHFIEDAQCHRKVCLALQTVRLDNQFMEYLISNTLLAKMNEVIGNCFSTHNLNRKLVNFMIFDTTQLYQKKNKLMKTATVIKQEASWQSFFSQQLKLTLKSSLVQLASPTNTATKEISNDSVEEILDVNSEIGYLHPYSVIGRFLTSYLSYPFTLIHAIEHNITFLKTVQINGKAQASFDSKKEQEDENEDEDDDEEEDEDDDDDDEELLIHVVGAAENECKLSSVWKYLALKVLKRKGNAIWRKISNISIIFVGYQVPDELDKQTTTLFDDNDKSTYYNIQLEYHKMSYEQYIISQNKDLNVDTANSSSFTVIPSLVVGFHLGLTVAEYEWETTLKIISAMRAPLLCTTFTLSEAKFERAILLDYDHHASGTNNDDSEQQTNSNATNINFNCECESIANTYSSTKIQQSSSLANDVFRANKYYAIYRGSLL